MAIPDHLVTSKCKDTSDLRLCRLLGNVVVVKYVKGDSSRRVIGSFTSTDENLKTFDRNITVVEPGPRPVSIDVASIEYIYSLDDELSNIISTEGNVDGEDDQSDGRTKA